MNGQEVEVVPLTFDCDGARLVGLLHVPARPRTRGVVLVLAGGPQYRVGVHRHFVKMSRALSADGYVVLRFDYRGMGDSEGEHKGFLGMERDIQRAVDTLMQHVPALRDVVLWGECESASAVLFYAHRDPRVGALMLVNPWVRTEEGQARTYLKHYYWSRLFKRNFWRKLLSGRLDLRASLRSMVDLLRKARVPEQPRQDTSGATVAPDTLPARTADGIRRFTGPVLIVLCGRDYIAREFDDTMRASHHWRGVLKDRRITVRRMDESDHSFTRPEWSTELMRNMRGWLNGLQPQSEAGEPAAGVHRAARQP